MHFLALLILCLSVGTPLAFSAVYVVDQRRPQATDDGPGSEELPFKSIHRAAAVVKEGDTVLIRTGTYRESVKVDQAGTANLPIVFKADIGANVIVTGADLLTGWRQETNETWSVAWSAQFINWNKEQTHPGDPHHRMIGRCEQVFVAGYPMLQVLQREAVTRGTFFVDEIAKRLFVCGRAGQNLSDGDARVEASTRQTLWEITAPYVQTKGIHFRYAANMAQHGMALFSGQHDVVEDCVFERSNSSGATFTAEDLEVRRCTFQENGQLGFGACLAHRMQFSDCVVRDNNVKDFERGWEAGGCKVVLSHGAIFDRCRFIENRGAGLWFDIGNEACEVRNCLLADNEETGIFYEISYGLHVHDCVFSGNGFHGGNGAWGCRCGLSLSSSPNCVVERNLFIGNAEGFNFREANRTTPRIGAPKDAKEETIWNHNQSIRNNFFAANTDAQVRGWFDIADERHWPKALQEHKPETAKAQADLAAEYKAKDSQSLPPDICLEKLDLRFTENCYAILPGQPLFTWGVAWKRNKTYPDLPSLAKELKFEENGKLASPDFSDTAARDFRLPKGHPALLLGAYPNGAVPSCLLGQK